MNTPLQTSLDELKEDLEILGKQLSEAPDLKTLDKDQLDEFGGRFLVAMISLEGLLDDIYFEYFADKGAPQEDTSTAVLAEFVKMKKLSEKLTADLFDAMAVGLYFMSVPSWVEAHPQIPQFVDESLPRMKDYHDALIALVTIVDELKKD